MMVSFRIPGQLRVMTCGCSQVDVETAGGSLRDALEGLFRTHPGVRDRVLTERGEVRQHVNLFVGKTDARSTGGLATPLTDGAEISIIPAISGGSHETLPRGHAREQSSCCRRSGCADRPRHKFCTASLDEGFIISGCLANPKAKVFPWDATGFWRRGSLRA
jgi:molybdopterin converting factor small subunit